MTEGCSACAEDEALRLEEIVAEVAARFIERKILASGQIPCPRPHEYLFAEGSRCYCGAQT